MIKFEILVADHRRVIEADRIILFEGSGIVFYVGNNQIGFAPLGATVAPSTEQIKRDRIVVNTNETSKES